ncbi:hypothetical protein NC651_037528 [Populus alba x Populus x berolinensis]|nr:hypothetical protein NC651_037528 [Populus alba x Populus x berolinensis]
MENPRLSLLSSSSPKLVMGYPTSLKNPTTPKFSISTTRPSLPFPHRTSKTVPHSSRISISALSQSHVPRRTSKNEDRHCFGLELVLRCQQFFMGGYTVKGEFLSPAR